MTDPLFPRTWSFTSRRTIFSFLCAAILINVLRIWHYFSFEAVDFDAAHLYLPYAKQLLAEGVGFFGKEKSVYATPMAYVYPALFGGNPIAVKFGNIFLSTLIVVMVYRTGRLLYSTKAGLVAALSFSLSPLLTPYIPTILTEPLYFFCLSVWIWSISEIVIARRSYYIPVAGIAFGIAILTRGVFYYFLFPILLITLFIAITRRDELREIGKDLFLAHAIALLFPLAFIFKNWLLFDYAFFTTGTGNALYFGSHPLVNGYELPYYGLGYDEGAVTREVDHLSIAGDTMLKGVALSMLSERTWTSLLETYFQKTMAFIFVTKAILPDTIFNLRSFRIVVTVLSMVGLFALTNRTMRYLLAGILLYQVLAHMPLLYQHRYSVGALDLWLVILSAIGLVHWAKSWQTDFLIPLLVGITVLIGISYGEWHRKNSPPFSPDVFSVPHDKIWIRAKQDLARMEVDGMAPLADGSFAITGQQIPAIYIPVRDVPHLNTSGNYVLTAEFSVGTAGSTGKCQGGQVFYKRLGDAGFSDARSIPFKITPDEFQHIYHFGGIFPLALNTDGDLRFSFYCASGTVVNIARMTISEPQVARSYREKYLNHVQSKK